MGLLAGTLYDPGTAVSKSTASLLAMTALDTTNLRLTFTAPGNGSVLVRLRGLTHGSTSFPRILLGVLDGSTVKMRMSTMGQWTGAISTSMHQQEAVGVVTGLTAGTSYTWDAAYGVDVVVAATNLKYGGPNDSTANNAFGGFLFEIWDTVNLLAAILYDPATAATLSATSLLALTALDTTNLRITFAAPPSGQVMWRIHTQFHGSNTQPQPVLGILDGSTVKARVAPIMARMAAATDCVPLEGSGVITGLTPGTSYTYDAAYGVETVAGAGGIKHGGPDNATTNDAFGATAFEIWAV